jgi:virginiamycin B lyase
MRNLVPKLLAPLAVVVAAFALASSALAAPAVTGIFPVESELSSNNKIVAGPDGNMWMTVEGVANHVAKITPAGKVEEFKIGLAENGVGIAVGPEGKLWVPTVNNVTSFSPANPEGTAKIFALPNIAAEGQIVAGPDGLMWVASNNNVVTFSPSNPVGTEKKLTLAGELSPKDIDVAGSLIAISDNSEGNRIVTFTSSGVQKDFAIGGASQGLAGAPSGQIAFSAAGAKPEQAGLINPPGAAQSFELIGDPFGVTYASDQAFWIVQFAAGGLTRLTPAGARTFLGGLPVETARQVGAGPSNTLWVTLQKKEKVLEKSSIARISGLEPPVVGPPAPTPLPIVPGRPQTKLGKGPKGVVKTTKAKAVVKFSFSADTPGASFECALTPGKKTKKGKLRFATARFHGCKSPRSYRVAAGSYRFKVRAGTAGGVDSTPAERRFRVVRTHK